MTESPSTPGHAPPPVLEDGPGVHASNFHFPHGFLWGAATSSHQVEGNNTRNDWWAWEQSGKVRQPSGLAADHYRRFHEDFDLAHGLAHNAHRFSLEWSRIEPEPGRFDSAAIEHYREVLLALRERNIEPVVTLHHFTLPAWLAAGGGWHDRGVEDHFVRFVECVLEEYAPLARWWITINEPVVQVFKGYLIGQWPPGRTTDYRGAFQAVRHMLRAHVRAYHAIHQRRPDAMVSVAQHVLALQPCNPDSWTDRLSVRARDYLFNNLFIDSLHSGWLAVPGQFFERLPMSKTLDFIGLNYYTRDFVKNSGLDVPGLVGTFCKLRSTQVIVKRNDLGWEIYPEGLGQFLHRFARYHVPLLVTENGIPSVNDRDRWTFILLHLWQVARAIADGVPVVGYLHWSLLDNFEWADGYGARFGLVGVDFRTQQRTVRDSALRLAQIIRANQM